MKLHITSGEFRTINEVANIIGRELNVGVQAGTKIDIVQKDAKNKPDLSFQEYWKPSVSLEDGIRKIIKKMQINL